MDREELWLDRIKGSCKKAGVSEIFVPGEISKRKIAGAGDEIVLPDKTYEDLKRLLKEVEG